MACGKRNEDSKPVETPTPKESRANESPSTLQSGSGETIDPGETRLWGGEVKARLARIARVWLGDGESGFPDWMDESVVATNTDAFETREVYRDENVRVTEWGPPETETSVAMDAENFIRMHREILCLAGGSAENAVRFKLYGIDEDGRVLKTRQRLTARGMFNGNPTSSYAVVEATWRMGGDDEELPRLTGLAIPKLIRTELRSTGMFEDIAEAVLGGNPAWVGQLKVGMNSWARRLERSLKPDFLGYNGLAVGDINGDGLEDLYLCQAGGLPNLLFKQQPGGTLKDISASAGVDWLDNTTGALLSDLDNDGDADLALATQEALLVMANGGNGEFTLRTRLSWLGRGYSPTAADYDLDGDLDLLVLRYGSDSVEVGGFPTPHPFYDARNGGANVLLENRGDFQFADVTNQKGFNVENHRFSFAASWEDFDNDGDSDVYVANDFGPNQLFRNDGGRFVDVSVESRTQDWGFGMSATWADYNRDGLMDLYVSSMFSGAGNQVVPRSDFHPGMPEETRRKYLKMVRGNTLLRNLDNGRFKDVTDTSVEGFVGWAWGAKFADFNNDGWEDLYVANGYISQPDTEDL